MNILIPHSWLLEHLETDAQPSEIQKYLSLCGPSIERIYEREGEAVYDIEVTTNRVDCMSVRGIAREAAVILPQFGVKASLKPLKLPEIAQLDADRALPLPHITNDPRLCKRVMYVILKNVAKSPTPDWMAKRLLQTEMNVHHSMIDITNYITHELGHPCHAFDYDKIMTKGGQIIVKEAKAGKPFTTLDGESYKTVGREVVFENEAGEIIDLPAIKGTANTAIDDKTKNVLFWIESLDPAKVRFGSMSHAIRTVAAQLNEKDVDPQLAEDVLARGIELYQTLCQAEVASPVYDDFPQPRLLAPINVKLEYIAANLGLALEPTKLISLLQALGCEVTLEQDSHLLVQPPSFRPDLTIPADVVEEIARVYGYHNLPSKLMDTAIPLEKPKDLDLQLESSVKHFLADIGWQEVYTYSLVSEALAAASGYQLEEHLRLQNPLTDDKVVLRRSLIPSLQEVLNNNPMVSNTSVFELANVYQPQAGDLPRHEMRLGLVSKREYRQVRGAVEALADHLFIKGFTLTPRDQVSACYQAVADISAHDKAGQSIQIGELGMTPDGLVAGEFNVVALAQVVNRHPTYTPIPKTMPIIEDLTFTIPEQVQIGPVMSAMQEMSPVIVSVVLKDIYQRNFTFTISYQDPVLNLEIPVVEEIRKNIVSTLAKTYQATLVGMLN